jgi:hypothetical protein
MWTNLAAATLVVGAVIVTAQVVRKAPSPFTGIGTETFTCRGGDQVARTSWDGDEVPSGAVAVRLCQGNSAAGPYFHDPLDELTTNVDAVVEAVNLQPVTQPSNACNGDGGIGYTLLFSYPDEPTLAVAGEMYGCRHLTVGGDDQVRLNPEVVWDEFLGQLRAQRIGAGPPTPEALPDAVTAPECGADPAVPLADASEMTSAVLCSRQGETVVPTADLAVLMDDRRSTREDRDPTRRECDEKLPRVELTGMTAWGDPVVMTRECGVFASWGIDRNAGSPIWWRPSAESQAILDRLIAEIRSP